ncbi:hypothetical protein [Levilactobacillus fuyuanensis]|uniref:Uncharacterized protein n=1 Tax=Levilactobacillus fuyuanensis TaxID=2486022 RepID=A0ABW4H1X8_9LACO|nr:hypothetical protein [Levilactobacillus fuyuanensis]
MKTRIIVESLTLLVVVGLIAFLIFRFVTDFKTTLLVILALAVAGFIKNHFFKKDASR